MKKVAGGGETDGCEMLSSHCPRIVAMEKVAGGGEMDGCEMWLSCCPWIYGGKGSW